MENKKKTYLEYVDETNLCFTLQRYILLNIFFPSFSSD